MPQLTARTVAVRRGPHGAVGGAGRRRRVHLGGLAGCTTSLPGLQETPPAARLSYLGTDHCLVQPFAYAGREWLPPYDKQFGNGGGTPPGFIGLGTAAVQGELLVFTDVSGTEVDLLPADDPRAEIPQPYLCD